MQLVYHRGTDRHYSSFFTGYQLNFTLKRCQVMKCSDWENVVSWTRPSVLLCKPYQRFGPDSVFITFLSLFIPGFNASDFVKFSSCSVRKGIDQSDNESKHSCEKAIDSILCENGNVFQGNNWIEFELENPETFDTIIIFNGNENEEQKLGRFKIKLSDEKKWHVLSNPKVKNDLEIAVEKGSIILSRSQDQLEITFEPIKRVGKIQIELIQSRNKSTTINEVLIPSKWNSKENHKADWVKGFLWSFPVGYPKTRGQLMVPTGFQGPPNFKLVIEW